MERLHGVQNACYKDDQGKQGTKRPGAECILRHLVVR